MATADDSDPAATSDKGGFGPLASVGAHISSPGVGLDGERSFSARAEPLGAGTTQSNAAGATPANQVGKLCRLNVLEVSINYLDAESHWQVAP